MGFLKQFYSHKYNYIFQSTLSEIENTGEEYLENIRDTSYIQVLPQITEETKDYSKLDLELVRVDSLHQLDDIKEEISEKWYVIVRKTTIVALTYNYFSYLLLVPGIVLLFLNQVLAAQVYSLIALAIILLINIEPVRNTIAYNLYGINRTSNELADLYLLYGSVEAIITVTDYRKIYKVDRSRWIFSDHHQKAP